MGQFKLGVDAIRLSVPFASDDAPTDAPQRCLMYPPVSCTFLLVLALRSGFAKTSGHGLLEKASARTALARVFRGMLPHVAENFTFELKLDNVAEYVRHGGCSRLFLEGSEG